jgi:hypothetical protein
VHRTNSNNKQPTTSVALHAAAGGGPQGLWKALEDLSPEIIPPANAMDDPFPGVGLSIDSLYGDNAAQVAKKVAEPVARAFSEPATAKAASDSISKASEEMSKASDKFSKAFDSAFTAAKSTAGTTTADSEPVLQASSAASTTTTSAASVASEQVVAQAASEPVAKAVEPVVQATVKASEPVLQAATPAIKTGAYAVQPNEYMMQVVEKNSALSKSISDAVHGTVEKVGSAFSFQIPESSFVANKEAIVREGTSSVDMVGMFDNVKFNFDVPTAQSIKISPEQFAVSPEQLENIRQNIAEFGTDYVAALDSFYHIFEFQQALVTGTAINEGIRDIIAYTNNVVERLDLEHYSGWYATLAVFFWGATQRREGEVLGRLLSERKIQNIEKELAKTKAKAEKDATKKASEVEELKEQMVSVWKNPNFACRQNCDSSFPLVTISLHRSC